MKRKPTWTARHYLPSLYGAIAAGVYAQIVIHLAGPAGIVLQGWEVPLTAQVVLWVGIWLGRITHFD